MGTVHKKIKKLKKNKRFSSSKALWLFFPNPFYYFFLSRILFPGKVLDAHRTDLFSLHMRTPKASEPAVTQPPEDRDPTSQTGLW